MIDGGMQFKLVEPGATSSELAELLGGEVIRFDPKGDPHLISQMLAMSDRGALYSTECSVRGVKFLPKQVMRPVFVREGLGDGPMVKTSVGDFLFLDFKNLERGEPDVY